MKKQSKKIRFIFQHKYTEKIAIGSLEDNTADPRTLGIAMENIIKDICWRLGCEKNDLILIKKIYE